jgi:hypothetical protein
MNGNMGQKTLQIVFHARRIFLTSVQSYSRDVIVIKGKHAVSAWMASCPTSDQHAASQGFTSHKARVSTTLGVKHLIAQFGLIFTSTCLG